MRKWLDNPAIENEAFKDVEAALGVHDYLATLRKEGPAIIKRFRKLLKKGKKP